VMAPSVTVKRARHSCRRCSMLRVAAGTGNDEREGVQMHVWRNGKREWWMRVWRRGPTPIGIRGFLRHMQLIHYKSLPRIPHSTLYNC
jgi:hypothetical protein